MKNTARLGVNIDHVATLRQLRDTPYPDVLAAAELCIAGGADQITVHLREDRRHICDQDVHALKNIKVDLNLEMAATDEMLKIALQVKPHSICIVPEKREERTTEGGLNLKDKTRNLLLKKISESAIEEGILPSFFIEPDEEDILTSKACGAQAVEFHTGALCIAFQQNNSAVFEKEWQRLKHALSFAQKNTDLHLHAGHGIDYILAPKLAKEFKEIEEYNIGHSIVCEAVFIGLKEATHKMKAQLNLLNGEALK